LTRQALRIAATVSAKRASAFRVLVNDRLDVAIAERAHGVHLGETSLPVPDARRLIAAAARKKALDESFLVGVSTHSIEAALNAERDGADYIFFGPVFATPSKAAFGAAQGVARLAEVCRAVGLPVVAIGGITVDNANACLQAGAAGLAAIRLYQDALEPASTVVQLHERAINSPRRPPADQPSD